MFYLITENGIDREFETIKEAADEIYRRVVDDGDCMDNISVIEGQKKEYVINVTFITE